MTDESNSQRLRLVREAEYLTNEVAFGDAVSVDVLVKSKPFIETLASATVVAKSSQATDDDVRKLQLAMIDVMAAIAPVSLTSLHDTECSGKPRRWWFSRWRVAPVAGLPDEPVGEVELFSDSLVITAILFLVLALGCTLAIILGRHDELSEAASAVVAAEPNALVKAVAKLKDVVARPATDWISAVAAFQTVIFGGLGACTYLLRALHKHIHERTFDRRYKPEYLNRIVLGMVSGGVVTMLVQQTNLLPDLAGIGSAALAFIVGYNTDLLFSLLERISNAILPKVPDAPTAAAVTAPITPGPRPNPVVAPAPNPPSNGLSGGNGSDPAEPPGTPVANPT
jgi:hypothetical protein